MDRRSQLEAWLYADVGDGTTRDDKFLAYLEDIAAAGTKFSIDAIALVWKYAKRLPPTDSKLTVEAAGISDTVARLNGDLTAARADVASEGKQD